VTTYQVDVVLPCLDEAEALPWVLSRIPSGYRALVVDNGSSDDSVAIATALGATVIEEPRRGFGAACHAGLSASASDVVCFMDCDATLDPRELGRVVAPLFSGAADIVFGRRVPADRHAWPTYARAANALLASRIRRRTTWDLRDLGPMRAARREQLLALELRDRGFGYPLEMALRAAAAGWRYQEVPVAYRPRVGASKVTGTVRGCYRALRDMRTVWAA